MKKQLLVVFALLSVTLAFAGTKLKGDVSGLKGADGLTVVMTYNNTKINKASSWDDYVAKTVKPENKTDWEAGVAASEARLIEKMEATLKDYIKVDDIEGMDYTMTINIDAFDGGYYAGISMKGVSLSATCTITDKSGGSVAVLTDKLTGSANSATATVIQRMKLAYGSLGKRVGKTIAKKLK